MSEKTLDKHLHQLLFYCICSAMVNHATKHQLCVQIHDVAKSTTRIQSLDDSDHHSQGMYHNVTMYTVESNMPDMYTHSRDKTLPSRPPQSPANNPTHFLRMTSVLSRISEKAAIFQTQYFPSLVSTTYKYPFRDSSRSRASCHGVR